MGGEREDRAAAEREVGKLMVVCEGQDAGSAIDGAVSEPARIRVGEQAVDRETVAKEHAGLAARGGVPGPDRSVGRCAVERVTHEDDIVDGAVVSAQPGHVCAVAEVPEADPPVPAGRGEEAAVSRDCEGGDRPAVAFEAVQDRPVDKVPDDDCEVIPGRCGAVVGERDHGLDRSTMALEPTRLARRERPETDRVVEACRQRPVRPGRRDRHYRPAMAL